MVVYNYTIQDSPLPTVSSVRDLGVLFDDNLSFKLREQNLTLNTPVPLLLPLLLYHCLPLQLTCFTYLYLHIDKIESIQHKLLRYLAQKSSHPMPLIDNNYVHLYSQFNISHLRQIHYLHDAILCI